MKLKRDYEATFKEGLRLGMRLTRAKGYMENARDAKRMGDDSMAELYMEFANDWSELARNIRTIRNHMDGSGPPSASGQLNDEQSYC